MGEDDDEVLDRAAFADFASLFARDELDGIVEQWHADSVDALEAIAEALTRDDHARIGDIAHRTAGGALALGAEAFAEACERLRAVAESGDAVTEEQVAPVRAAAATTYAAMNRAVAQAGAGGQ